MRFGKAYIESSLALRLAAALAFVLVGVGSASAQDERVGENGAVDEHVPDGSPHAVEDCEYGAPSPSGRASGRSDLMPARAGFAIQFQDAVSPFRLMSTFVLPGDTLEVNVVLTTGHELFRGEVEGGRLREKEPGKWSWIVPEQAGSYCMWVREGRTGETLGLKAFVMRPYDGEDVFHGYRIGRYERIPLRGDPAYAMPEGLVEVTRAMEDEWVSPHFQLRQFLCKQESDYPKFLILHTRLLVKLEMILEQVNRHGIPAQSFYVMSGYRTPHYNFAIGNRTRYSRHAYGDAADIFIDMDRDGTMDDLDGNGRVGSSDARLLYGIVDGLYGATWYMPFVGGLGLYGPKPHRGPFVHVDTRGRRARW